MSKIGEKPIAFKEGVTVSSEKEVATIKGPLGEVQLSLPEDLKIEIGDGLVLVKRTREDQDTKARQGTYSRLISNAIVGVCSGFEKTLEIVGTGFRGQMEGETLVLSLGFSHPVKFKPPEGIKIEVQENKIKVFGVDRQKVGLIADKIKRFKKPDPYKGKGIRYSGEKLRLKPGKIAAKTVGGGGK